MPPRRSTKNSWGRKPMLGSGMGHTFSPWAPEKSQSAKFATLLYEHGQKVGLETLWTSMPTLIGLLLLCTMLFPSHLSLSFGFSFSKDECRLQGPTQSLLLSFLFCVCVCWGGNCAAKAKNEEAVTYILHPEFICLAWSAVHNASKKPRFFFDKWKFRQQRGFPCDIFRLSALCATLVLQLWPGWCTSCTKPMHSALASIWIRLRKIL